MTDQKFIEAVSEEIKQDLENNGIPRKMLGSIPDPELRDKVAAKWFNPLKLWYAVPQKPRKLRQATAEDMKEVMEMFRDLVKDDEHRASTTSR